MPQPNVDVLGVCADCNEPSADAELELCTTCQIAKLCAVCRDGNPLCLGCWDPEAFGDE